MSARPRPPGSDAPDPAATLADLPLLAATRAEWAPCAAAGLASFLADHAVCEQQVAQYALSLAGFYPEDLELVEAAGALAAEEVQHFRRVVAILKRRGWPLAGRRSNRWAQALRQRIEAGREPWTRVDRLCFGALIEARSCERFTRLLVELDGRDPEVERLLHDLGPAEARHWRLFRRLAGRDLPAEAVEARFRGWLEFEAGLQAGLGVEPTVHG
jgi:tRNA 2-(methylsulfanyl)-N6-isopentenyladenosine37 hydroxylase